MSAIDPDRIQATLDWQYIRARLSPRVSSALYRAKFERAEQVANALDSELRSLRNIGPKGLAEIRRLIPCRWTLSQQAQIEDRADELFRAGRSDPKASSGNFYGRCREQAKAEFS